MYVVTLQCYVTDIASVNSTLFKPENTCTSNIVPPQSCNLSFRSVSSDKILNLQVLHVPYECMRITLVDGPSVTSANLSD